MNVMALPLLLRSGGRTDRTQAQRRLTDLKAPTRNPTRLSVIDCGPYEPPDVTQVRRVLQVGLDDRPTSKSGRGGAIRGQRATTLDADDVRAQIAEQHRGVRRRSDTC
mgnify:CR=1 FL=1